MGRLEYVVAALIGLILAFAVYMVWSEEKSWQSFSLEHKCKVIAYQSSQSRIGYGIGHDGKSGTVVITDPSRTTYLCDDGVQYTR